MNKRLARAIEKVMVDIEKLTPEQLKRELKKHENGWFARVLMETKFRPVKSRKKV